MQRSWKESIYLQREQLARVLDEPLQRLAERCSSAWGDRDGLNTLLLDEFPAVPHCKYLYCLDAAGRQICDNIGKGGLVEGHYRRDRSQRPYMQESMPGWGFLLSDAYISQMTHTPSLTALRVVRTDGGMQGYLGADFDLRSLPVTALLYDEPGSWRQVKGDPAIRGQVFQQCRIESPMDHNLEQALSILGELLTARGVFQCQIHFSSSQATLWTMDEPFRYRILDNEALADPDICMVYPSRSYPSGATIPPEAIAPILDNMQRLRLTDETFYLRTASINIFNGLVSVTFSCDGSHYMPYQEFLLKGTGFWF